MRKYLPAGLTQYVLNNFSNKSPPCHGTQDDVSTPLQRLEVEKITGHQSVRGRRGVIAVMYETTGRVSLDRPGSGKRTSSFFATKYCATGRALLTSTTKPAACTAGCELVLHNGNFLGVTASVSWSPATAAFFTQNGLAATAPPCFPRGAQFWYEGGDGLWWLRKISASTTTDGVYLVCSLDGLRPIKFLFLRHARRLRRELHEVLGVYKVPLASALARGVQRNVNKSQGAAVDS